MPKVICEIKNLRKHFPIRGGKLLGKAIILRAVDGISFNIIEGETFGLVGESGCGKTTTARCIVGLTRPTEGKIHFMGKDIFNLPRREMREIRREISMIFQDPLSSLDPRWKVRDIISEPLVIHGLAKGTEKRRKVEELMEEVGINPQYADRYPHQFSTGQQQRIAIARALATKPKFIVADEPVASLDVSLRANILNLMKDLQRKFKLTYLYISHDLSTVKYMSNRVAVMYLGKIVELAATEDLFSNPLHPYTKALISAIPIPDPTVRKERLLLYGEISSPINPPIGCRFHPRCPCSQQLCKVKTPRLIEIEKQHFVACHLADE